MTSHRRIMLALLAAVAAMAAVGTGCTVIHSEPTEKHVFDPDRYGEQTHYSEIMKDHGPPTKLSRLGTGMVWLYEDVELSEHQFGIGFDDDSFSIFKLNLATGGGTYRGTVLTFDEDGRLTSAGHTEDDVHLGGGAGFQFIFTVGSLVNLSDVRGTSIQHAWGKTLLDDLPESLNSGQDLETGEHGVQLQTTPGQVGQHSLAAP